MLKSIAIMATLLMLAGCGGAGSPMRLESRTGETDGTAQAKLERAASRNASRIRN